MRFSKFLTLFIALIFTASSFLTSDARAQAIIRSPQVASSPNPDFVREFGKAYQLQLESWIPAYDDTYWGEITLSKDGDWIRSPKSLIPRGDALTLVPDPNHVFTNFPSHYPKTTNFYFGQKFPEKIGIVYDPVHHIALYTSGCCSWRETVVAADTSPPPTSIPFRKADLFFLRTHRGVALNDTPEQVMQAYGFARRLHTVGLPDLLRLSYSTPIDTHSPTCLNNDEFIFRENRLIAILLVWGC